MAPLLLIAVLSHLYMPALAAGPLVRPRPTLLSPPPPQSSPATSRPIDLINATSPNEDPPPTPWDLPVHGTNINVDFLHFQENDSGNNTEGLMCIRDAIAAAGTRAASAPIDDSLLNYNVGRTNLHITRTGRITWGMFSDSLGLLDFVTEVYANWQYLFDIHIDGRTEGLASGALVETPAGVATV